MDLYEIYKNGLKTKKTIFATKEKEKRIVNKIRIRNYGSSVDPFFKDTEKNDIIFNHSDMKTYINYGILLDYCPICNHISSRKLKLTSINCTILNKKHLGVKKIRVLSNELKEIQTNKQKIPKHLINKITSRELY